MKISHNSTSAESLTFDAKKKKPILRKQSFSDQPLGEGDLVRNWFCFVVVDSRSRLLDATTRKVQQSRLAGETDSFLEPQGTVHPGANPPRWGKGLSPGIWSAPSGECRWSLIHFCARQVCLGLGPAPGPA